MAAGFAGPFCAEEWAYIAGLRHDEGKGTRPWQAYLRRVNNISDEIRADAVKFAKREVKKAEDDLRSARIKIKKFQNRYQNLDPEQSAISLAQTISNLQSQLLEVEKKLATQGTYMQPDSAEMKALRAEKEALDDGIIPAVAAAAHARPNPVIGQQMLPGVAGVLAALVRVQQQSWCTAIGFLDT